MKFEITGRRDWRTYDLFCAACDFQDSHPELRCAVSFNNLSSISDGKLDQKYPLMVADGKFIGSYQTALQYLQKERKVQFRGITHIHWKLVYFGIALVLALTLGVFVLSLDPYISSCEYLPYQRLSNPDTLNSALIAQGIRDFACFHAVRILLGVLYVLCIWRARARLAVAVVLGAFLLSFFPAIFAVEKAKILLGDVACNVKPNSVSGHSFYFVFVTAAVWYFAHVFDRHRQRSSHLPHLLLALAVFLVAVNGFFTVYYGYHSVRQVVLGLVAGAFFSGAVVAAAERALCWLEMRRGAFNTTSG